MRIAVIGNSLQSLVASTLLASVGNNVVLFCASDLEGTLENEPGLITLHQEQIDAGRLVRLSEDAPQTEKFKVLILAEVDLNNIQFEFRKLLKNSLEVESAIVILTPTKIGEAKEFARDLSTNGICTSVSSVPLLLREGRAIQDFSRPESIVIGCDTADSFEIIESLFYPFNRVKNVVKHVSTKEAEFTCFASHAMLATRLSFINEMASLAERSEVDIEIVRESMGLDPRIGHEYLYPGCGYGGRALAENVDKVAFQLRKRTDDLGLLDVVSKINERQKDLLFRKIWNFFNTELKGKKVAIWGASFKPGSSTIERAPSISLIESLIAQSATVAVYDPMANNNLENRFGGNNKIVISKNAESALDGADVLAICTEWKEFWSPDYNLLDSKLKSKAIFDGRNILNPEQAERWGIKYFGIGRGRAI